MGNIFIKNTNNLSTSDEILHRRTSKSHEKIDNYHELSKKSQNFHQNSSCKSLQNLSSYLNWSLSGSKYFLQNRDKSFRKSLSSLQQNRSKTIWHRPISKVIFSSHFKEYNRNEEFTIDHLIAKGAFGVVFKVNKKDENNKSTTSYALKVLKKSKIIEENSLQQIKDEADIQKLCGHFIFIVKQIDLWQSRRNLYILLEYLPNGELFSKITSFTTDLIRLYLAEISLAIDFLHNAGVIYRDAKPENILLTYNYHIKITDFGLSKWLKLGSRTRTLCGTFQYMAPEILRGETYDHSVDWWSIGIIVYQMYTKKIPNIQKYLNASILTNEKTFNLDTENSSDLTDNIISITRLKIQECKFEDSYLFLDDLQNISYEGQDVLKRLLQIDSKLRLHSILALQKIALYKNFKICIKHLQSISPLDLIEKSNIILDKEEVLQNKVKNIFDGF